MSISTDAIVPGKTHYTLLAGSLLSVPVYDKDGNEIAYETHKVQENICVFIEDREVKTARGVRVPVKSF